MSGRVDGTVVVVSGAGRGQGAAGARLLACDGATVVAVDLAVVPDEDLKTADYRRLDVMDADTWAVLATELGERYGPVDGFVANAGVTWRARRRRLLHHGRGHPRGRRTHRTRRREVHQ